MRSARISNHFQGCQSVNFDPFHKSDLGSLSKAGSLGLKGITMSFPETIAGIQRIGFPESME
jgi:hypothetical protein